jgi:putative transposase
VRGLVVVYQALCRLLQLVVLLGTSERSKELEILVLRHELAILRRQPRRAPFRPADRAILAAFARPLPRSALGSLSVRPATLLRWHRQLVGRRWTHPHRRLGRPPLDRRVQALVFRLARENPGWGYKRIVGELRNVGISVSATSVRTILTGHGFRPAPQRDELSWRNFLRQHAATTLACDFFTRRDRLAETDLRALLPLARESPGGARRLHTEPNGRLGRPAGAQPADERR